MSEIQVSATFTIHDGKLDEFKTLAEQFVARVREVDTQTQMYQWFLSPDGGTCEVREVYPSSEALLEHLEHVGDLFGPMAEVADFSPAIYGDPSPELLEATADASPVVYHLMTGA